MTCALLSALVLSVALLEGIEGNRLSPDPRVADLDREQDLPKPSSQTGPAKRSSATVEVHSNIRSLHAARANGTPVLDCWSLPTFLFSDSGPEPREVLWELRHRGFVSEKEISGFLPRVEASVARVEALGESSQKLKQAAGQWLSKQRCDNQQICSDIAATLLGQKPSHCTLGQLLGEVNAQLESTWRSELTANEAMLLPASDRSGSDKLSTSQLAVKLPASDRSVSDKLSTSQLAVRLLGERLLGGAVAPSSEAGTHLNALLAAVVHEGNIIEPMRIFLRAAEDELRRTNSTSRLVPLLRLLYQNRDEASSKSLARDAAVVLSCEQRVSLLEQHQLSAIDRSDSSAIATLRHDAEDLLSYFDIMIADHKAVLPDDSGVLPAYWSGRVQRLKRQLDDHLEGRKPGERKTVLIWTCSYGKGHRAATKALRRYLPEYNVIVSDVSKDLEFYEDDAFVHWIREHLISNFDNTWFFNEIILRQRLYWMQNVVERLGGMLGYLRDRECRPPECDNPEKRTMRRVLLKAAPDLTITDFHMKLLHILELAEEHNGVPLLHLATDVEAKMWEIFNRAPDFPHFRLGLPFPVQETLSTITPVRLEQSFVSGYAVRPAFLAEETSLERREQERRNRGILPSAQVALVMSGGGGQAVPWPAQLADSTTWREQPLHVIVVAGSNSEFGFELERRYGTVRGNTTAVVVGSNTSNEHPLHLQGTNPRVSLQVSRNHGGGPKPFFISEHELATLMDISDVLITKAGGSTSAEAAYRGVPVLFDAVNGMLKWEEFTAHVFESHNRSLTFFSSGQLEDMMSRAIALGRSTRLALEASKNGANYTFVNTSSRVRHAIQDMLEKRGHGPFFVPSGEYL